MKLIFSQKLLLWSVLSITDLHLTSTAVSYLFYRWLISSVTRSDWENNISNQGLFNFNKPENIIQTGLINL